MELIDIAPGKLKLQAHDLFLRRSVLLSAGDFAAGNYNSMTIGWAGFGTMWNKPLLLVAVRPGRFTYPLMEAGEDFTVTAFPESYKRALAFMGSHSGRDGDKASMANLTPVASQVVKAPTYAEAELVIECRKMYVQDIDPKGIINHDIDRQYPLTDYHRFYFGEIVAVRGLAEYAA